MGITETLASFVATTRYEDIPTDVIAITKRLILDTIGNLAGGISTASAELSYRTAAELGGERQSTILFRDVKTTAPLATFANISSASALESDDSILNMGHIAHCCFFPALALGERDEASGRSVLTATTVAYEFGARIARAGRAMVRKPDGKLFFGNTGIGSHWAILPVAASAARIIGLNAEETASTFGIAGFTANIPTGRRWNRPNLSHQKYQDYALAAQSAVMGALLSRNGYRGDPDVFDGDARDTKANWWAMAGFPASDPESATNGLGEEWLTRKAGFKPYPSCRFTHGSLDRFRRIVAENHISADDIEKIDIYAPRTMLTFKLHIPEVNSAGDCEFSMPHVIAMSALGIPVGPQWVAERYWHDPKVAATRSKVECHVWEEANASIVEQILANDFVNFPTRVVVRARGSVFQTEGKFAMGDHDLPETRYGDAEVIGKFRAYSEQALSPSGAQQCIDRVMSLDKVENISALADCIRTQK
jgi:2-methylcitrate dehydratase PrpD